MGLSSAQLSRIRQVLDPLVLHYNQPEFIENDPISIPHLFSKREDIEIAGFFAAVLAWGQRKTILSKCRELLQRMDNAPHDFVLHHQESDLRKMEGFVHRTFSDTDLLYFLHFLQNTYRHSGSLEAAFFPKPDSSEEAVKTGLIRFRTAFTSSPWFPARTGKHISSPASGSACKRLNMFLRWMVRKDQNGVDFGIWNHISPAQLICPCDVHVERNARRFGLVSGKATDWTMATELTQHLRQLDPDDPVKYDFALFGMGAEPLP